MNTVLIKFIINSKYLNKCCLLKEIVFSIQWLYMSHVCTREKNSIFICIIIVTQYWSRWFSFVCITTYIGILKKSKTDKYIFLCIQRYAPCHSQALRQSRYNVVSVRLFLSRVNQDRGWERDEDAKNIGRNDLFPSSCSLAKKNAIFTRDPGHLRVSRRDTWTLSHESLEGGYRDFAARPW